MSDPRIPDVANPRKKPPLPAILCVLILLCAGGVVLFAAFREHKREDAEKLVKAQSKIVVKTHGKGYEPPNDPWGTPLEWQFVPNKKVHKGTVISAGPDKTLGTDDDIHHTATDYKKTGIAAEWAGSKAKDGIKGFIRGLRKPSNHEDAK